MVNYLSIYIYIYLPIYISGKLSTYSLDEVYTQFFQIVQNTLHKHTTITDLSVGPLQVSTMLSAIHGQHLTKYMIVDHFLVMMSIMQYSQDSEAYKNLSGYVYKTLIITYVYKTLIITYVYKTLIITYVYKTFIK